MMIRRSGALVALIAALTLAGCAGDPAAMDDATGAGAAGVTGSASTPSPAPSVEPPTEPRGKGKPAGTQTISGTIAAGVEPNCLLLNSSSGSHLLIIKDEKARAAAKVGSSVTVVGTSQDGMMTTCQQGTPFVVSQVRAD